MSYKINASAKLYLLVFVLSMCIIGIGIYGITKIRTIHHNTQTLYADRIFPLQQLTTIRYSYAAGILSAAQYARSRQFTFSEAIQQIQEAQDSIASNWHVYMLTWLTPEEAQLATQTSQLINETSIPIEKLKVCLKNRDTVALENIINNELYPATKHVISKLNELVALQVRVGGEVYKNSAETYQQASKEFYILIAVSLLFAIIFSFYIIQNINELIKNLRESNQKIGESEEKYRLLIEQAADAIFLIDSSTAIIDANHSACKLLGYSLKELLHLRTTDLCPSKKETEDWSTLRKKGTLIWEEKLLRKDGTKVDVEVNAKVLPGKGFLSIVRDITERKRIEAELSQHKIQLALFIEHSPASLAMFDNDMRYIATSRRWLNDYDLGEQDLIGKTHYEVFPEIQQHWKGIHQRCLKGAIEKSEEDSFIRTNGSTEWMRWEIHPWRKATGEIGGIIMFTEVITERKKATELFKRQFENSPDVILIINREFKIESMNKSIRGGTPVEELIGINSIEILPPESREEARNAVIKCFETGETQEIEGALRFGNWARSRFVPIFYHNGVITHIMVISTDISERKKAEESIKQSEANYRQLFDLSPAPMWVLDDESYRFIQVNKACVDKYGYSEEEFAGMTMDDIGLKEDETGIINKFNSFYMRGSKHVKRSGEIIDVETASIPVVLNGKKQILMIAIDVTEKNRYEQKLTRAAIKAQEDERYEIGGELHDNVCQILASSLIFLGLIKESLAPGSKHYFEEAYRYISLASDEIRGLSHRLAPAFFDEATLEDAFENLLTSFNVEKKYIIKLDFDRAAKTYPLSRDLQLNLYRILQEQLRNIFKHANATRIDVAVTIHNNILQMRITDNGVGFDIKTSKGGIGLANMNKRTQLSSGNFAVDSEVGKGCEVLVEIPLSSAN